MSKDEMLYHHRRPVAGRLLGARIRRAGCELARHRRWKGIRDKAEPFERPPCKPWPMGRRHEPWRYTKYISISTHTLSYRRIHGIIILSQFNSAVFRVIPYTPQVWYLIVTASILPIAQLTNKESDSPSYCLIRSANFFDSAPKSNCFANCT